MFKLPNSRNTAQALLEYLLINLATLLILLQAFDLSLAALKATPLVYAGDGLDMLKRFKLLFTGEWSIFGIAQSTQLGAPFGYNGGDFAQPIAGQLLAQKLFTLLAGDPIYGFNLFVVSSYFLATSAMHWTLRRLGVPVAISAVLALLFTFQPFHYLRIHHTNYIQYFFIPVLLVFMLDIWKDTPLFFKRNPDSQKITFANTAGTWLKLAVIAFFALWNFYYTFFLVALCLTATLSAYAHTRHASNLFSGLLMLAALVVPTAVNYVPYALYKQEHGKNEAIAQRQPQDAISYGLKISDMLMPISQHRLQSFREVRREYENTAPLMNETTSSSIGLIASAGLLLLFIALLIPSVNRLKEIAILNIASILIATVGGFGSIAAYTFFTQIRGYNRISIIIATLALVAIGLFITRVTQNLSRSKKIVNLAIASLLAIGLLDQIAENYNLLPSKGIVYAYNSDSAFVREIERSTSGKPISVFQLPYICAPECDHIEAMEGYAHLAPYMHSQSISWSYGGAKGRMADAWYSRVAKAKTTQSLINTLQESGFSGIYINRLGYSDRARQLEAELSQLTGLKPLVSPDNLKSFFPLNPSKSQPELFSEVLGQGFYGWEGPFGQFTWAKQTGVLHYSYLSQKLKSWDISFMLHTRTPRTVVIEGPSGTTSYTLTPDRPTPVTLHLEAGKYPDKLTLRSLEPAKEPGNGDTRKLAFALSNLSIVERDSGRDLVSQSRDILP